VSRRIAPAWLASLALVMVLACTSVIAGAQNRLPAEAQAALQDPESVELYALEPWKDSDPRLQGYHVLGKAELDGGQRALAIAEFEASVARWQDGGAIAACFDPHHALRIAHGGHHYDFLLCYQCQGMRVYRDGVRIGGAFAAGSAAPLNALLVARGLPLPHIYTAEARAEREREAREKKVHWARWQQATPRSLAELLAGNAQYEMGAVWELPDLAPALEAEIPDRQQRILALLAWFGSGVGPWSGFPSYESVPERLLLEFDTEELVTVAQSGALTTTQREGAARLFAGWYFSQKRKGKPVSLPDDLKRALLEHVVARGNKDNIERARSAFAQ
jgi:hypothetical protein